MSHADGPPGRPAIKATLLLALVTLVAWLLSRRRPAWQGLLWASALTALLLLPIASALLPALQVPILPSPEPSAFSTSTAPPAPQVAPSSDDGASPRQSLPSPSVERPPEPIPAPVRRSPEPEIPATKPSEPIPVPARPRLTWPVTVSAFYLAGLMFSLLRIGVGAWRTNRLRRSVSAFGGPAEMARLDHWRNRLGVGTPVDVGFSDRVSIPTVVGIRHPLIVVPAGLASGSHARTLDSVFAHELAHVKRRDALWNFLGLLATALYWYHPLVHLTRRWLAEAREYACDDWGRLRPRRRGRLRLGPARSDRPPGPPPGRGHGHGHGPHRPRARPV
ncbi:MAG: hypothetical protein EXS64_19530 [Candidatus Latescibacteria bacterium]|nr:hypothetical protein [Candidatus Latescibacterota bacterium]